ncbi:MAG: type II secretion system F family protein [Clostridiales bacterium]|jgi:type II secretory pathway component PulF|nr:type II secretion system F family protein [Clostridiales bacterium]
MPLFVYKAANEAGKTLAGRIDRNSAHEVTEYLALKGLYPLEVRKLSLFSSDISDLIKKPVSLRALALFCRQLSFFLESGMLLPRALQIMTAQSKDKRVKRMLMDIHGHSLEGKSLSDCLKTAPAPPFMAAVCHVGEESGRLAESIRQLAEYYEKEYTNRKAMTGALIYPAFLAVMMFALMILAVMYVIPNYTAIFDAEGIALPLPTRILASASCVISDYGAFILMSACSVILLIFAFLRSKRGAMLTGFIKLRIPIWRLSINLRFCRCLSMLLSSGQPAHEALNIIRGVVGNAYLDSIFLNISTGLRQGRKLSTLLAEAKYFDPLLITMVETGEETGNLSRPVAQCAAYYQTEQDRASALYAKLAEPAIMIFLGSVLALIMLSIILPTFDLVNAF